MAGTDLVQALSRGLDLLQLASASPEGASLRDLASSSGLKTTTVHNLLRTLTAKGFLEKLDGPVRFCLGPAVVELAQSHTHRELVRNAADVVRDVFRRHPGATVVFAEDLGDRIAVTLRISPEQPHLAEIPPGRVLHAYGSSSALVFQAYWTEGERSEFRKRNPFWEYGAHLWGTEKKLDAFLSRVRDEGYARPELEQIGETRISAPVFARSGGLAAALGAAVPAEGIRASEKKRLIRDVVDAARQLSQPIVRSGIRL